MTTHIHAQSNLTDGNPDMAMCGASIANWIDGLPAISVQPDGYADSFHIAEGRLAKCHVCPECLQKRASFAWYKEYEADTKRCSPPHTRINRRRRR